MGTAAALRLRRSSGDEGPRGRAASLPRPARDRATAARQPGPLASPTTGPLDARARGGGDAAPRAPWAPRPGPWWWQAAALKPSLEAVVPAPRRATRGRVAIEDGGPEALAAAVLGGVAAGYRLVDARLDDPRARRRVVEFVPPGATAARTADACNVTLPPGPGGARRPEVVPGAGCSRRRSASAAAVLAREAEDGPRHRGRGPAGAGRAGTLRAPSRGDPRRPRPLRPAAPPLRSAGLIPPDSDDAGATEAGVPCARAGNEGGRGSEHGDRVCELRGLVAPRAIRRPSARQCRPAVPGPGPVSGPASVAPRRWRGSHQPAAARPAGRRPAATSGGAWNDASRNPRAGP